MADNRTIRLNKVLKELNISLDRAVEHLAGKGFEIEARPTTKISDEEYAVLQNGFQADRNRKVASKEVSEEKKKEKEALRSELEAKKRIAEQQRLEEEEKKRKEEEEKEKKRLEEEARLKKEAEEAAKKAAALKAPKVVNKIELDTAKKPEASKPAKKEAEGKSSC